MNLHPTYKISSVNLSLTPRSEKGVIPCLLEARQVFGYFVPGNRLQRKTELVAQADSSHVLILHVRTYASSWNQNRIQIGFCYVQKLHKNIHSLFLVVIWLSSASGYPDWGFPWDLCMTSSFKSRTGIIFPFYIKQCKHWNPLLNTVTAEYTWFIFSFLIFLYG